MEFLKKYFIEIFATLIIAFMYFVYVPIWFSEWINPDSNFGYGFYVLGFIGYYLYKNYEKLSGLEKSPSGSGIPVFIIGLLMYIIGFRSSLEYISGLALPVIISGIIITLHGMKLFKSVVWLLLFFMFTIPIWPLYKVTLPLKVFSAKISSVVFNLIGLSSFSEGSIVYVDKIRLAVTPACSGIRSLSSLVVFSIIYTYFINFSLKKKVLATLLMIPFSLFMNVIRILIVGFFGIYNGYDGLEKFHDNLGLVLYVISIAIFISVSNLYRDDSEEVEHEKV